MDMHIFISSSNTLIKNLQTMQNLLYKRDKNTRMTPKSGQDKIHVHKQ